MKTTNDSLIEGVVEPKQELRRIAYAGTFDPMTKGHLDLIERGLSLCDELIVVVINNLAKNVRVPQADRKRMVEQSVQHLSRVKVTSWQGLFAEFCHKENISVCLRGLRSANELESEKQMARLNRELKSDLETVFLTTSPTYDSISSSAVRELAAYGVKLDPYVPAVICREVERRYSKI